MTTGSPAVRTGWFALTEPDDGSPTGGEIIQTGDGTLIVFDGDSSLSDEQRRMVDAILRQQCGEVR